MRAFAQGLFAASILFAAGAAPAFAQQAQQGRLSDNVVRIGVLTDISGVYADISGRGAVEAVRMAVEDFGGSMFGRPIEVVFADHQNKADVGAAKAREWFDVGGVDMINDLANSGVALAVARVATEKKRTGGGSTFTADIDAQSVARCHPRGQAAVFSSGDRGQAVIAMSEALCALVSEHLKAGAIDGMLGIGGSGGTSMIAPAMQLLPLGMPKLLVSTMAAGNMAPFVDVVDMTTMFPVTDIAGLNRLSRRILANAAHALAGMLRHSAPEMPADERPAIGITMFGVTTPCVQALQQALQGDFDTQVFHANGSGGRTLERLAASGQFVMVVDITTTEVGQHLAGAVCDAGPGRLEAASLHGLPWIGSIGALDMLNWGPIDTVPAQYRGRLFHVHNANVTLMRTTADEMVGAGRVIAERLNAARGPVWLYLPEGGLSALDAPGKPFHDPVANRALFETLEREFETGPAHHLVRLPYHINDPEFASEVAARVRALSERGGASSA